MMNAFRQDATELTRLVIVSGKLTKRVDDVESQMQEAATAISELQERADQNAQVAQGAQESVEALDRRLDVAEAVTDKVLSHVTSRLDSATRRECGWRMAVLVLGMVLFTVLAVLITRLATAHSH